MEQLVEQFGQYGLPGLIIVALAFLLRQAGVRLDERDKVITELQEKRIAETRELVGVIRESTDATKENTTELRELRGHILDQRRPAR